VENQQAPGSDAVEAFVVAGVGSTAIGTAALARNVADALERPVGGIVSGYGLSDVLSEALSGFFVFGAKNALRQTFARVLDASGLPDHVRDDRTHDDLKAELAEVGVLDHFIYGSPDSTTLLYLLVKLGPAIKLLVGHSKGNLSIENALEGVLDAAVHSTAAPDRNVCIVTLGAVLDFPAEYSNVHQFLGDVDVLGMVNSRPFIPFEGVPGAWHSLNETLPGHVTVSEVLEQVRPLLSGQRGPETPTVMAFPQQALAKKAGRWPAHTRVRRQRIADGRRGGNRSVHDRETFTPGIRVHAGSMTSTDTNVRRGQ
jgi:hypothetical protein